MQHFVCDSYFLCFFHLTAYISLQFNKKKQNGYTTQPGISCMLLTLFITHFFSVCPLGGFGAMEWALPEIGHLRYRWRNICLDSVWGSLVCGAGEWPWSTGIYITWVIIVTYVIDCKKCVYKKQTWKRQTLPLVILVPFQVSDFTWSHDGTQALISYRDGFVLVGSVSGQRHWSSEINLESQITCGIWTPDDQQVIYWVRAFFLGCYGFIR